MQEDTHQCIPIAQNGFTNDNNAMLRSVQEVALRAGILWALINHWSFEIIWQCIKAWGNSWKNYGKEIIMNPLSAMKLLIGKL